MLGQLGYGLATLHAAVELLRSLCLGSQHDGTAPVGPGPDGASPASSERPCHQWAVEHSTATATAEGPPAHLSVSCSICQVSFGFFTRRHHCRACGALCCDACSRERVQLQGWAFARRVCDPCFQAHLRTATHPLARTHGGGAAATALGGRRDALITERPASPGMSPFVTPNSELIN